MAQLNTDVASVILEYADYFERAVLFDILFPGSRNLCYKRNLKKIHWPGYCVQYRLFRRLHREDDLPAVRYHNGILRWYINDKCHRDRDKPAFVDKGLKKWYCKGLLHREKDRPAVICAKCHGFYGLAYKIWFIRDKKHRDNNLPAVIYSDGYKEWYINGVFIRNEEPNE